MRTQKAGKAQMVEAIMLFGEHGIAAEMLYPEFQALLDNMVTMPHYADEQIRAAYVLINPRLLVRSLVLFYLDFDDKGQVDSGWNLDLRHLAEKAGTGPDLGAGPIRLACRSQCPVPWYQMHLWDPEQAPASNHFKMLREAVANNSLRLAVEIDTEAVLSPELLHVVAEDRWQNQAQIKELQRQAQERDKEQRYQAAQLIKQQRLQIRTLESTHTETLAKMRQHYDQRLAEGREGEKRLRQQLELLQRQNDELKAQWSQHASKIKEIRADVQGRMREMSEKEQQQLDLLKSQYESELQMRLDSLKACHQEQLQAYERDLAGQHEKIQELSFEHERLQQVIKDLTLQSGEQILQRLEEAGISFVALHPGAGHMSIPLADLDVYMENPQAYAAKQCLVTEEQYLEWLAHYETASCDALIPTTNTRCGLPLERKSHPGKFVSGVSNRCSRHRRVL